jgi:hypothetical protein
LHLHKTCKSLIFFFENFTFFKKLWNENDTCTYFYVVHAYIFLWNYFFICDVHKRYTPSVSKYKMF